MRVLLLGLALIAGCGNPRSRDQIFAERESLPQVYLGLKSPTRIVAPASKGMFVDPETKDEFWPAMVCVNPNCPQRQGGEPVLFVHPRTEVNRGCPHCMKKRDLKAETPEEKDRYDGFVTLYVLPDTKARQKELDQEFKRAADRDARYRRN